MDKKIIDIIKSSELIVGTKQVLKGIENGTVRCVIVADHADEFIKSAVRAAAKANKVEVLRCSGKLELGRESGIEVGAAVVGVSR